MPNMGDAKKTRTALPRSPVVLFICTTLLVSAASLAQSPPQKPTQKTATKATASLPFELAHSVTVAVMTKTPPDNKPLGSAVWIGKNGYLATCEHVIRGLQVPILIGIAFKPFVSADEKSITIAGAMSVTDATVIASDRNTDVAILKAAQTPAQFFRGPLVAGVNASTPQSPMSALGTTLQSEFPKPGDTVLLAGYPLTGHTLILQTGPAVGLAFPTPLMSADGLRIMLSLVSNPGNSGGPVLDATGKVVGLLEGNLQSPIRDENNLQVIAPRVRVDSQGQPIRDANGNFVYDLVPLEQNSGISVAIPAKFILRLAKEQKIQLE
jgi:S1-C subfamily serine protease